jgi:hypothetical protein
VSIKRQNLAKFDLVIAIEGLYEKMTIAKSGI